MDNSKEFDFNKIVLSDIEDANGEFMPILADGDESDIEVKEVPETLPILPLRNTVLFPSVVFPISVGRSKSLELVREVYRAGGLLGTVAQKVPDIEEPTYDDLYSVGVFAKILKILEMPDGTSTVIIQGRSRVQVEEFTSSSPYIQARVRKLEDVKALKSEEFTAIVGSLKDLAVKIAKGSNVAPEASFVVRNIENPSFLINFVCSNANISVEQKQELLQLDYMKDRGQKAIGHLVQELQMLELKKDIQEKVQVDMNQQQREYLLQQQMKTIQSELGSSPSEQDVSDLEEAAKDKKWNEEIGKHFDRELKKLSSMNAMAPDYSNQLNYLQTMVDLPWGEFTEDNFNLKTAEEVLENDHFGLEEVKNRILEHLAVLKLKKDMKSPIICLYGPPGVGKTSLGKSIARALGRKYERMSLGGLHDESEIRGHRKTYIGAMPGRIIQGMKKAKSSNPVFILDEIDKVSSDFRGDPSSALLEVLDPEQNSTFHDNYLEVDYDLSNVMFIATANTISNISQPLRDRMEMIDVSGYLMEEKIEIAQRHLLPKQLENHGVEDQGIVVEKPAMQGLIEGYTRESGVREMDKQLAKLVRRIAKKVAFEEEFDKSISADQLKEYLGTHRFSKEMYQGNDYAGVVTGLAWTAVGGEILYIESSLSKGKGGLALTGNLGDVMKESAMLAQQYIKSHAEELDVDPKIFEQWNVHVHVPEGAIPKDGPSAGITMATSLASLYTQRKVKKNIAMTGEITLIGKVLPVGGIKEKILAAKRAGIKEIILSKENRKDIEEIKEVYIKGLKFHYVERITEVLDIALLKTKVENPLKF